MDLKECYINIGGDYDDVIVRLRSEKIVKKFVLKFLEDTSYELLCNSLSNDNYKEAFRAAHTLKGVCQNLSFTKLYNSSNQLTELLRNGFTPEVPLLVEKVKEDYNQTITAIKEFQSES